MLDKIFDINKFNIFCDEENYYFFRALNMADNADIENGITLDSNGKIISKFKNNKTTYNISVISKNYFISVDQNDDNKFN